MLRILASTDSAAIDALCQRRQSTNRTVERRAATIVDAVRRSGDQALLAYARRFDQLDGPLEIGRDAMRSGARQATPETRAAIAIAAQNIRKIAQRQVPRGWRITVTPGVTIEQRVLPLERVGCYVPGGRHPLPSSLLMTAIPARMAGVPDVIAVSPWVDPTILAAAVEAKVSRLFRIGGAQAIAALAYGTESVPRVDKIVGPGNAYVAAAKRRVSVDCAIDFHAGPSEIVVVARTGDPDWIAADLVAQAEHDPDARAIFLTPSRRLAGLVAGQVAARLPRTGVATESMTRNGAVIVTRNLREAVRLTNRLAPEHVVCENDQVAREIHHAGTVFVGTYAAQAAGDYATGSNHVLPTNGVARARGGLSASDFVRVTSIQRMTRRGLSRLAPTVLALAKAEGLDAHAASVQARLR